MSPVISERGSLVLYLQPPLLRLLRGSSAPLYREGDIVIGVSPTDPDRHICKRICATEFSRRRSFVVPRGYVWLEGDNKCMLFIVRITTLLQPIRWTVGTTARCHRTCYLVRCFSSYL